MLQMKKERFDELGLGYYLDACRDCEDCIEKDGEFYCSSDLSTPIKQLMKNNIIAECVDDERVRIEMTDAEYDAYRHNRIQVV